MNLQELNKKTNTYVHETSVYTSVRFHETVIVLYNKENNSLLLDNGGYYTQTTKRRMNDSFKALGIDAIVYQEHGKWYFRSPVNFDEGFSKQFSDKGSLFVIGLTRIGGEK